MPSSLVAIGKIVGPHGIKGGIKVLSLTDFPEQRFTPNKDIYLEDFERLKIKDVNLSPKACLLFIEGINDRNAAEKLRGKYIYAKEAEKIRLPKDSYLVDDIIGCLVIDADEEELGTVIEVLKGKANDVYVLAKKNKEFMVPAIKEAIIEINIKEKIIRTKRDYLYET